MEYTLRKIVISLLLLANLQSYAQEIRTADIEGVDGQVSLYFSAKIVSMLALFQEWEMHLQQKGIEADFYLASGDFRRAVLHTEADGPGDVEVLVHLNNKNFVPTKLVDVLEFLKKQGVDIEARLHELFADTKKIDIFVKDQYLLQNGWPYVGELGSFEGMGDNSVNQLRYSPSKNRVEGDPSNLRALKEGKILFLEMAKTAKLTQTKQISRVKAKTEYPATLLRMALRSIRLEVELLLSPNPNQLSLDKSFSDVLHGFELYFAEVCCDQEKLSGLSEYELPDTYLEQFLKIFRGRTKAEKKKIKDYLVKNFKNTVSIWSALGLDIDALMTAGSERRAIIQNARYNSLRPFLNAKLDVRNPFKVKSLTQKLLNMAKSAKGTGLDQLLSISILDKHSPSLSYLVRHFDELDFEMQLSVIDSYVKALKYFAKPALGRLQERTFIDVSLIQYPLANPDDLDKADKLTLLEYLESLNVYADDETIYRIQEPEFSSEAFADLLARTKDAVKQEKVPILALDLDGVLFITESRKVKILKAFDLVHGTDWFKHLTVKNLLGFKTKEFLYFYLETQITNSKDLLVTVDRVNDFYVRHIMSEEFVAQDDVNIDLVRQLAPLFAAGAKPLYITARTENLKTVSIQAIQRAGLPAGPIQMGGTKKTNTAQTKAMQIKLFHDDSNGSVVIGFLDNDRSNVNEMSGAFPDFPSYRVFIRDVHMTPKTILARSDISEFEVYGKSVVSSNECQSLLNVKIKKPKTKKKL